MEKRKVLKYSLISAACVAVLILLWFVLIWFAFLKGTFVRDDTPKTAEHDQKFYATDELLQVHKDDIAWFESQQIEKLSVVSFDGLKLAGLMVRNPAAQGTVIMMHGFHSNPMQDFASLSRWYYENGWNIVLPYQRSHHESEGKYLTFGVKESRDVPQWVLKINEIFGEGKPVFIHGISMGCATVVMSLDQQYPANVKGIIADCGFTSPYDIVYWTIHKVYKIPFGGDLVISTGNFLLKHIAGFSLYDKSTTQTLSHNKLPVFFVSGADDKTVPVEMTLNNFLMCGSEKQMHLVEGCPHAIAFLWDREGYEKRLVPFLNNHK